MAGRAIRCKCWRNRGLPAEAASTSMAAADTEQK
jgi:hypothetical protein